MRAHVCPMYACNTLRRAPDDIFPQLDEWHASKLKLICRKKYEIGQPLYAWKKEKCDFSQF